MKSFIFKIWLTSIVFTWFSSAAWPEDSVSQHKDSVYIEKTVKESKYDKRQHRYRKNWASLIPTQLVTQYAGNMGFLSTGIGWDYGRHRQWETHLMVGFLPRFRSKRAKITMTVKENFIPWSIDIKRYFSLEPLSCGFYVNTIFGHEFWAQQPVRYPSKYYELSTKFRPSLFLGERVSKIIPENNRKFVKSVTAFYEFSSTDLDIYMRMRNKHLKFQDVVSLSFGFKFQLL